jgi:hypothetical protein
MLPQLKPAELKSWLVALKAIQHRTNKGQLSVRQIADLTGISRQKTQIAMTRLVALGALTAITKPGCTTVYTNPFSFKYATDTKPDQAPVGGHQINDQPPLGGQRRALVGGHHRPPVGGQPIEAKNNRKLAQPSKLVDPAFLSFVRGELKDYHLHSVFARGVRVEEGELANEKTIVTLATILSDVHTYQAWENRLNDRRRKDNSIGWGLAVELARDVAAEHRREGAA